MRTQHTNVHTRTHNTDVRTCTHHTSATSIKISSPRVSACGSITSTASCRHSCTCAAAMASSTRTIECKSSNCFYPVTCTGRRVRVDRSCKTSRTLCLSSPSALLRLKSLLNSIAAALSKPCGIIERAWLISHN